MPTTVFRAVYSGSDHNTDNANHLASLYSGVRPAIGGYRVTGVTLAASAIAHTVSAGILSLMPLIGGDPAGEYQDVPLYHYSAGRQTASLVCMPSSMAALLAGGAFTIGASAATAYHMREFEGCVWTLTVTWEYTYTACTAPTSVALSNTTPLPGENVTLSWSGAAAGTGSTVSSYEVYRSPSAGGTYTLIQSGITAGSCIVAAPSSAQSYYYKVKAISSAGSAYNSPLSTAYAGMTAYSAPAAPTILMPESDAVCLSTTVRVKLSLTVAPNGGGMTLMRATGNGDFAQIMNVAASGGDMWDQMTLAAGAHTIRYLLRDSRGYDGEAASVSITVSPAVWTRAIETGAVISNARWSHQADIRELLAAVNALRAYAGLGAIALTGDIGRFSLWKSHMQTLQQGITEATAALGLTAPVWGTVPAYPTAAIINDIRRAIAGEIIINPEQPEINGITDENGNLITDEHGFEILYG